MIFGIILMLGLIILGLLLVQRGYLSNLFGHEKALNVLKRRYANGEISKRRFARMRKEIR
jgi:uncharacterized membrane protein